ncbi:MAG: hypothetical protein HQ495_13490 [Alphaproteobacteria bacterium]|nr:hypothetical protein [Alphaproteobacteria bacterium]
MALTSSQHSATPNNHHHWLAATIFGGIIAVWGIGMTVVLNASSVADAQAGTVVSVFSPADERDAIAAIRAAGGLLVANPAAGTWVVHSDQPGFAERLRREGALGVFAKLPVALPGASGCFFLPAGQRALFSGTAATPDV